MASPVTVVQTVTQLVTASTATPTSSNRAPPQGGIIDGVNPSHYNPKDPIIMFIIQAFIIIVFCRLLHWPLSKLRQPRVIAEVIGGILLGPSVMGRIPSFTSTIFPAAAQPNLALVANLGLTLFLFLVGLEVNLKHLVDNWKIAVSVGFAGMVLPFGLGVAIAWGLYNEFANEPGTVDISFGTFSLFIGVAMAITAFPVLCRILVELKLIHTPVGVIVLSAGIGNDVVGWVLLALCVALVNAGSGLTALWVLLTCTGYVLFFVYAVRPAFMYVLRRTHSLENGPSQGIIALTLLIALGSAFFTGIIGVHAIFGAFLAGLICPHEGGFAIKVTEKVEDLVSALLLPLYFALSGLNTNLGLLDNAITWGYVVGVCAIAFIAKFVGASLAARANGMVWRESFTIGSLMSCKGLVELIVLNIGLQAKILSTRTFTIFVVMALVTTFATTPLTSFLYPPWYQKKIEAWRRGEIDWDTGAPIDRTDDGSSHHSVTFEKVQSAKVQKILVYLRIDNMPMLLAFISLFGAKTKGAKPKTHPSLKEIRESTLDEAPNRAVQAHGFRMLELTERTSAAMKVSEQQEFSVNDPIVNTFRTFGSLNNIAVSGEVSVMPESSFAESLNSKASDISSDLILLPWSETGSLSQTQVISTENVKNKLDADPYSAFVQETLEYAPCTTAVFVNRNFGGIKNKSKPPPLTRSITSLSIRSARSDVFQSAPISDRSHHMFFPYFGGIDDRAALRLVLQMAESTDVTATIVHFVTPVTYFDSAEPSASSTPDNNTGKQAAVTTTTIGIPTERDAVFFSSLQHSLPAEIASRVIFETVETSAPLKDALARAHTELGQSPRNAGDLIVVGRNRAHRDALVQEDTSAAVNEDAASRCLGVVASKAFRSKIKGSVLVVQAAATRGSE